MEATNPLSTETLQAKLEFAERFRRTMNEIHAAADLDQLILNATDDLLALLGAERLGIFALDGERRELFSRYLDPTTLEKVNEIRVPISDGSIAGYVAQTRTIVRIRNARDEAELRRINPKLSFDDSWDRRTGLTTRQILAVPALSPAKSLAGVLQLVNSVGKAAFDDQDEARAREVAQSLGIALWNQRQRVAAVATADARRRFEPLVQSGRLGRDALDEAIAESDREGRPLEFLLMEKHGIKKKEIGEALTEFYRCPFVDYDAGVVIPAEAVSGINLGYLKSNFWVPLGVDGERVEVWIDDPRSVSKLRDIQKVFPGRKIEFRVGLRNDIYRAIHEFEKGGGSAAGRMGKILDALAAEHTPPTESSTVEVTGEEDVDESSNVVIRLANQIIVDAYKAGASDIHFEPFSSQHDAEVRIRVDGVCRDFLTIPAAFRRAVSSRLKVMARLDIAERRKPQDGKIRLRIDDREVELRMVTVPTTGIDNEDVVLRLLSRAEPLPIEGLSLTERNLRELRAILDNPHGLLLCVGPTGSGKTTTLHAALGLLNQRGTKIWTVEDPVEITQRGLRQVEANPKVNLTFPGAMRTFLRADPDVIMVGEMRDRETAQTAVEASLTGHLVLSTLHTNSAAESVTRLVEMGIDPLIVADSLLGILAQRLVRTVCKECHEPHEASEEEVAALARAYGEKAFAKIRPKGAITLQRGKGCDTCGETGYRGRVGIHELLVGSDEVRRLVRTGGNASDIHAASVAEGMTTLIQDGVLKVLEGKTDLSQVLTVVSHR